MSATYRAYDQHNHEDSFRKRTRVLVLVLGEEEQRRQTDLLNVQPDEDVLEGLGEEQSSGVARARLLEQPQEQVLVEEVEEHECNERKTIDHRGDDRVGDSCRRRVSTVALQRAEYDSQITTIKEMVGKRVPNDTLRTPYLRL